MVFHQCFILSTGFAAMMRLDDTLEMYGHGSFVFGCFAMIQCLRVGTGALAGSDGESGWVAAECLASSVLHLSVFAVCVALRRATIVQSAAVGVAERVWRVPRPTIFSLQSWRAKLLAASATALAIVWQGQCVFMVINMSGSSVGGGGSGPPTGSPELTSSTLSLPQTNWTLIERVETFNQGVNFGLHGAAFFLFHTVLSVQSRHAYQRLRELHILAGGFTGVYSLALLWHVGSHRGGSSVVTSEWYSSDGKEGSSNVRLLLVLLSVRACVCFLYGLAFMLYDSESLDADQEVYEREMREKHPYQEIGAKEEEVEEEEDDEDDEETERKRLTSSEIEMVEQVKQNQQISRKQTTASTSSSCPPSIERSIETNSKRGRYAVIFTGIIWSLYVTFICIRLPEAPLPAPTVLSVHRVGYGITFHVAYLLTLFAWDGFYSGNLVTLDVGRNFAVSTLVLLSPMLCVIVYLGEKILLSLLCLMSVGPISILVMARVYSRTSMYWSLDPLTGWKR